MSLLIPQALARTLTSSSFTALGVAPVGTGFHPFALLLTQPALSLLGFVVLRPQFSGPKMRPACRACQFMQSCSPLPRQHINILHWSMLAVFSPLVEPASGPFLSRPPCGWTRLSRMHWPAAKFASRLLVQRLTASVATEISAQTPESLPLPSTLRVARAATIFLATQRRFLIYRASSRRSCASQPLLRRLPC